jgi:hypothetical protein
MGPNEEAANFCTASGLACDSTNHCNGCGGAGQACCDGVWCGAGACCDQTAKTCVSNGAACGGGQGTCSHGSCGGGTCGGMGQACCGVAVGCTAPYSVCQGGTCVGCGGTGQPCCPGNDPPGGMWCSNGQVCDKGSGNCVACGASGADCCPGNLCNAGNCGGNGKCP